MTAYERMTDTNYRLITGEILPDSGKTAITEELLNAVTPERKRILFYEGVRFPGNRDSAGRRMYPEYYLPPYSGGRKVPTLFGQVPKTHILSANSYELEIIGLLCRLSPENRTVRRMADNTLDRLRTTCFGNSDDNVGECFDTNLPVLRFLAAAAPDETRWIRERIRVFRTHYDEKKRHSALMRYFFLCLSELPEVTAMDEIRRSATEMHRLLGRSYPADRVSVMTVCAVRNALSRLDDLTSG